MLYFVKSIRLKFVFISLLINNNLFIWQMADKYNYYFFLFIPNSDLGNNKITKLPSRVFHSQSLLKQLILRKNQIARIPIGLFENVTSLKWLILQKNNIKILPLAELRFLTSLQWLDISNNYLTLEGEKLSMQLKCLQEM